VTVVVKRYLDCISGRYVTYQATSSEPLSSVFDSGLPSYGSAETIRVLNVVAGRHVEMVLQHIGTLVVLRKHGRHFSVAVRTPAKVAATFSGALDVQLCTTRCPEAERLSLKDVSSVTPRRIERAVKICRQQRLVDFFFDACVFDFLATGGDRNFSLAAVHALRDFRRLSRNAVKLLRNRTTFHDTSHARNAAAVTTRRVTALSLELYLVTLLLLLFADSLRTARCRFSYAAYYVIIVIVQGV